MKKEINRLRVKGFTLVEMIVVVAIIGILVGVLAPTMNAYYRKSRIKSANADAKMVFNAAQTAAQSFIAQDRVKADPSTSAVRNLLLVSYDPTNGVKYQKTNQCTWGTLMFAVEDTDPRFIPGEDDEAREIAEVVNRTVSGAETICWAVTIKNYIVQGAIAAQSANSDRVGFYTADKQQAVDSTNNVYSKWFTTDTSVGGEIDTLYKVCNAYETANPTPLATQPTT